MLGAVEGSENWGWALAALVGRGRNHRVLPPVVLKSSGVLLK